MHVRHEEVGSLRGRRRSASDRRARRLRRQLRAGQSASHQRPVRLPSLAGAGARHRGANPVGGDRRRLFPGNASRRRCSGMQPLLRAGLRRQPDAAHVSKIAIREAVGKRGVSVVVIPGDVALQPASSAPSRQSVGARCPPRRSSTPAPRDLDALAALLNGEGRVTLLCGSGCQGAHDSCSRSASASRRRWCTRCAARSTSNGTIPTTSA